MLKATRQIEHHLRRGIMLAQSIGDGKAETPTIEDMAGKILWSKFLQGIIIDVGFVARKLWGCITLFPIVSPLIIREAILSLFVQSAIQGKTKPLRLT